MSETKIGFIGVGFMGHGMAKNLLQKGYPLWVKGNRNRVPVDSLVGMGATEVASAREMAEVCDIIHLCLSNSPQVEAAFHGPEGILAGARAGLIVIDATTADPTSTAVLAAELAAKGGTMVDAPLGRSWRAGRGLRVSGLGRFELRERPYPLCRWRHHRGPVVVVLRPGAGASPDRSGSFSILVLARVTDTGRAQPPPREGALQRRTWRT